MHELMLNDLQSSKALFKWINYIFSLYGIDPMNFNAPLNYSIILYIVVHFILGCYGLSYLNKESEEFVYTIMEIGSMTIILMKMLTYGSNHKNIAKILTQILKDYDNLSLYENLEEVHVALKYIKKVKIYFIAAVPFSFVNETMYFFKPLLDNGLKVPTTTDLHNVTTYVLPYCIGFHIENVRGYWLAFIYLIPMCYCAVFSLGVDTSLILALLAHVCGQLAVMSECVLPQIAKDMNKFSVNASFNIERHSRLVRITREINETFGWLLLHLYLVVIFLNCMIGYFLLIAISKNQKVFILSYSSSIVCVCVLLFLYCHAGQCLYTESMKLSDALYGSCWYNFNSHQMKYQLIFLTHSQICLRLTGNNFCYFSYESFLKVMKSSAAYLSVLRKIL